MAAFIEALIGPHNPFSDDYVKRELRWYGRKALNVAERKDDGLQLRMTVPEGVLPDYLNKNYRVEPLHVPVLFLDGKLWMSLTPMEIQSQFLIINGAAGDVGVAGLGMGYAPLKMAQSDRVDSVVVFEKDPRVIQFFKDTFKRRKGFKKFTFVEGDARKTIPRHDPFDLLYVDIYQTMLPDVIVDDIHHFKLCVHDFPEGYHFWGQERVLVDAKLGHGVDIELEYTMRAFLTRWMHTPVSTDPRLADTMLSDMYDVLCNRDYCERVLDALGMEY
jgi:hypothetical protein